MAVISYRRFDHSWFCSTLLSTLGIPVLALSLSGCQTMQAASSRNTSTLVRAASTDLQRHVAAEVQHRNKPRPASVQHAGELVPVQGIDSAIRGNTIIIQTPWIQNGQHIRTEEEPIYFTPDGRAFSRTWGELSWSVTGSDICINAPQDVRCMTALSDSQGQAYLRDRYSFFLAKVSDITPGDALNVRQAYADALERQRAANEMAMGFFALLIAGALMDGGGGSSSSGSDYDYYPKTSSSSSSYSGGGYSAPPINSFYGSQHGGSFYGH